MIRNILLDMGNVLLPWRPRELALMAAPMPEDAEALEREYFAHRLWIEKDRGMVTEADVLKDARMHLPDRLHAALDDLYENWHGWLTPLPGADAFVRRLKAAGLRVYLLSNAGVEFPDVLGRFAFYSLFDGAVVSAHEKVIKPDRRIYEIMLDRYNLAADECLFVDDMMENVQGAQALGIDAVQFDGDFAALERALVARGILG